MATSYQRELACQTREQRPPNYATALVAITPTNRVGAHPRTLTHPNDETRRQRTAKGERTEAAGVQQAKIIILRIHNLANKRKCTHSLTHRRTLAVVHTHTHRSATQNRGNLPHVKESGRNASLSTTGGDVAGLETQCVHAEAIGAETGEGELPATTSTTANSTVTTTTQSKNTRARKKEPR
jgi:hypothetical protein